jgi:hypothetical protein
MKREIGSVRLAEKLFGREKVKRGFGVLRLAEGGNGLRAPAKNHRDARSYRGEVYVVGGCRTSCAPIWRRRGFWILGFRAASSCQREPVPRYLRASCQRVSPEDMRIEVAFPPTLRFGATSRCDVVGRAVGRVATDEVAIGRRAVTRWAAGMIGDDRGLDARVGGDFIVASGMAASVNGYRFLEVLGGPLVVDGVAGGEIDIAETAGARLAVAASSSRFLAR